MTQHSEIPCPKCQRELRVRREYVGKVIVCNYCNHPFLLNLPGAVAPETPTAAARTSPPRAAALDDKIQRLSRELASEDARATQLRNASREVATLRGQLERAAGDLGAARAERDQALADLATLRQEMSALASGHEQRLSSLTEELGTLRTAQQQTETARAEAAREAEELRAGIAELEDALRQAAEGHSAALNEARGQWEEQAAAARRQLEGERSALQTQVEHLRTEAAGLRDERNPGAAPGDEVATVRLTEEIERLGQAFEAAAARERELEGRIEAIQSEQQQALAALAAERDAAQADAAAQRGHAARAAEEQARSAAAQRETRARLRSLQEQLDAERVARRGEADDLRRQVEALGQARDQVATERDLADRRRREDEGRFRGEVERLKAALADAARRHEALSGEGEQSAAAARALDEQLGAARQELAEKDRRLAELTEGQGRAAGERQSLKAALEAARKRLDQERALRQREGEQLAALRGDLDAARAVTAEACARADRAAEEQARLATRHQEAQRQFDAARRGHDEERGALHAEAERLRRERDDALRRADAVAAEREAVAAAREEPAPQVEAADDEADESWVDVGAAYEAALARDLGREAPERPPPRQRPAAPRAPARRLPTEHDLPAIEVEAVADAAPAPRDRRHFPIWACLPLALLLWVASLPAGRPLAPRESGLTLLLALTLLLQFRLWDELEDPGDERLLRPEPATPRGPLQLLLGLAAVWNAAYLAFSFSWPLLAIFVTLSVVFLLWNKGLRRLFPGPVASAQIALLKYPVLVYLLAAPDPPAVPEGPFLLALVLVYLGFNVFELLHDERVRAAPGSVAILALAMVLMLAVSGVMAVGMSDRGAPARLAQVILTGAGAAVFLLLFWRRRAGRAPGGWDYLVFVIAFAWLANFALGARDLMAVWADLRWGS